MAFTTAWDETVPADNTAANLLGADIRTFRQQLRERFEAMLFAAFNADPLAFKNNIPSGVAQRVDLGAAGGAIALSLAAGFCFTVTINASPTFSVTNVPTGPPSNTNITIGILLKITNGGNFAAPTWPAGTKWPSGTAPTLTTNGIDIVSLLSFDGGTTWNGAFIQKDTR